MTWSTCRFESNTVTGTTGARDTKEGEMHTHTKRWALVAVLFVAVIAVPLFASGAREPAAEETVVSILHFMGEQQKRDGLQAWIDSVQADYPDVRFEVQAIAYGQYNELLRTRIAAGDMPDLIFGRPAEWRDLVTEGHIMDLSNEPFVRRLNDYAFEMATFDGGTWGVPVDHAVYGVFYNKDMFAERGMTPPRTINEFVAIMDRFRAEGIEPISGGFVSGNDARGIWLSLIRAIAGRTNVDWVDDIEIRRMRIDQVPEVRQSVAALFAYLPYFSRADLGRDIQQALQTFASGERPMFWSGSWHTAGITGANPNADFGFFAPPATNNASEYVVPFGLDDSWMVAKDTDAREAVIALLDHMTSPEGITQWIDATGLMSAMRNVDIASINNPITQDVARYINAGVTIPYTTIPSGSFRTVSVDTISYLFSLEERDRDLNEFMVYMTEEWEAAR
jgi:ABC-type glycerol-3-phosphate transport system substrate-binding protein